MAVTVIRGANLAAKDRSFWFGKDTSSDPYFVIRFKNKTYTSEYRAQTLNPVWKSSGFDLGYITVVETDFLEIEVSDYDTFSSDDFMGMVRVAASALFRLGHGEHCYWFQLSDSKKYKGEVVSGKILVSFNVEVICESVYGDAMGDQSSDSIPGDSRGTKIGLKLKSSLMLPTLKAKHRSCCTILALTDDFSIMNGNSLLVSMKCIKHSSTYAT